MLTLLQNRRVPILVPHLSPPILIFSSPSIYIISQPSITLHISHLPALTNNDVQIRHILPAVPRPRLLHLPHDVHPIKDLPKDDVFPVQEGRGDGGDEELRAVAIGPGVLPPG
jgi:hypothetical protein